MMRLPKELLLCLFIAGFSELGVVNNAVGEEPPQKFVAKIFPVGDDPIHVIVDSVDGDPLGYHNYKPLKAHIVPKVASRSTWLKEPVFDVTEFFQKNGLKTPEGSKFLFSPSAKLLFVDSTTNDLELVRTVMSPFPWHPNNYFTFDLQLVARSSEKREKTILEAKSIGMSSGQEVRFGASGDTNMEFIFEPVLEPDWESVTANSEFKLSTRKKSIHFETSWHTTLTKGIDAKLGMLGSESIELHLHWHKDVTGGAPAPFQTPAQEAEAVKEIQEALKPKP